MRAVWSWNAHGVDVHNSEQVAIADIRVGDVVLHPERLMWMRVVRVDDRPERTLAYEQDAGWSETKSFFRRITLDPVHRMDIETFIPFDLDYRDAEQFETITRWAGGEMPPQAY